MATVKNHTSKEGISVDVVQFDTLAEAVDSMGEDDVLSGFNQHKFDRDSVNGVRKQKTLITQAIFKNPELLAQIQAASDE
jgi:hypothetical protein